MPFSSPFSPEDESLIESTLTNAPLTSTEAMIQQTREQNERRERQERRERIEREMAQEHLIREAERAVQALDGPSVIAERRRSAAIAAFGPEPRPRDSHGRFISRSQIGPRRTNVLGSNPHVVVAPRRGGTRFVGRPDFSFSYSRPKSDSSRESFRFTAEDGSFWDKPE